MQLKAIKDSAGDDGLLTGTGHFDLDGSPILGAVNISTDGTNAAVVVVRETDSNGDIIFEQSTKSPMYIAAPMAAVNRCYYSITGTGASVQFFQWKQ